MKMKRILLSLWAGLLALSLTILPAGAVEAIASDTAQGVVRGDNTLWMWGSNVYSQMGAWDSSTVPRKFMDDVAKVAISDGTTMAIKTDGSLWGWGCCNKGILGRPAKQIYEDISGESEYTNYYVSTPLHIMDDVIDVSLANGIAAVRKTDGSLWMLGDVGWIKGLKDTVAPQKLFDRVTGMDVGRNIVAVIREYGSLWLCEYDNSNGQIGWQSSFLPWMENVAQVALATDSHGMVVKTDGSLWAWGQNAWGQWGIPGGRQETWGSLGVNENQSAPVHVMDNVAKVSVDYGVTGILKKDGTLWTCGRNNYFNLGTGDNVDRVTPVQIMTNVVDFDIASLNSLARRDDGTVWCWGYTKHLGINGACDKWNAASTYLPSMPCQSIPLMAMGEDSLAPASAHIAQPSAWAKSGVDAAQAAGLIPELTDSPSYQTSITREQFAELAVQLVTVAYGEGPDLSKALSFTDCTNPSVLAASAAGIVSGVEDGKFAPKATTNREQIATMVARAIDYLDGLTGKTLAPNAASIDKFTDKGQVSAWAVDGVGTLAANGIMTGTSATTLSPKDSCTVEQSILLLYRVYQQFQGSN